MPPAKQTKNIGDMIKTAAAVFSLVVTLIGFIAYGSGLIHAQTAMISDVGKLQTRVGAVEDLMTKTNFDRFRLDRSEQEIASLRREVTEISKNVVEIRIMVEKLAAQQGILRK